MSPQFNAMYGSPFIYCRIFNWSNSMWIYFNDDCNRRLVFEFQCLSAFTLAGMDKGIQHLLPSMNNSRPLFFGRNEKASKTEQLSAESYRFWKQIKTFNFERRQWKKSVLHVLGGKKRVNQLGSKSHMANARNHRKMEKSEKTDWSKEWVGKTVYLWYGRWCADDGGVSQMAEYIDARRYLHSLWKC